MHFAALLAICGRKMSHQSITRVLLACFLQYLALGLVHVTVKASPAQGDCLCTMDYTPVCGDDGNTYGNACSADCAGVSYQPGACTDCTGKCPRNYDPVCSQEHRQPVYDNPCIARCQGVGAITRDCIM